MGNSGSRPREISFGGSPLQGFDVLVQDHFFTLEDTIDTVGKSVLGLTIAYARCLHDHKYDPISNRDYYALYGILREHFAIRCPVARRTRSSVNSCR